MPGIRYFSCCKQNNNFSRSLLRAGRSRAEDGNFDFLCFYCDTKKASGIKDENRTGKQKILFLSPRKNAHSDRKTVSVLLY